jgi:amidase
LFGLKPTRARNPLGPELGDMMSGFVAEHVVSRTVRDSAALLDVTAGPDVGDPYWAPPQLRPYREEVGDDPGRLRIALLERSPLGDALHEDCLRAVRDVGGLCESLGHTVEQLDPDVDAHAVQESFFRVFSSAFAAQLKGSIALVGREPAEGELEPLTLAAAHMGSGVTGGEYLLAVQTLQSVSRAIARTLLDYDVWLTPTICEPPFPLGTLDSPPENPLAGLIRATPVAPFTAICNFTGQPAMSVPLVWNDAGLPIGTQFIGRFGDEATLFRLAGQLEAARPWAQRRPPISA